MLVSGVIAGIAAGIAFGGDWHRLAAISIRFWPILAFAAGLRVIGAVYTSAPLNLYLVALVGIAVVSTLNWRLPGSVLIAIGTLMNVVVVIANGGMPFDASVASSIHATLPTDTLHVPLGPDTKLRFLADVIPVGVIDSLYSPGDFLIALGGFLIPFIWLQAPAQEPSAQGELRSRNFALFWLAQVVSRFGDPITLVALVFVTYRETQSALLTALAVVITTLPNALLAWIGGAIADATGRRRAMLWCDSLRALLISTVPILLGLRAPIGVIFTAVFLAGTCGAVFNPARVALVRTLVSGDKLTAANAVVYASDRAVEIGGALAGGVLVATMGDLAFFVDAATFALSAVLLSRIVVWETATPLIWTRLLAEGRNGLVFIRRSSTLWANTVFSLLAQVSTPVVNGLTPVLLVRRFAGNDPNLGALEFGAAEAAIALGAVLGSAALSRYLMKVRKGILTVIGFGATGATVVLISLAPTFELTLGLFVVLGVMNVVFYVPNVTILQEHTPVELSATVFGARIALLNLTWLPVILVSGALGDAVGVPLLIAAAGAITLTTAIVGAFIPSIRDVA